MDERDIFLTALEIEPLDARQQYLRQACEDDLNRLARVESLLRVYEREPSFLQSPAVPRMAAGVHEAAGAQIGPYKLIKPAGEGGFGVVFLAEQQQPVRRIVALKIIKPGMDTREVVARFEAERQALAMMEHPNIARVFDGGTTESGRPYFVMELVKGMPITSYCEEHGLIPCERLRLFTTVCQAVQHAHQKGVIHRDLKATNVLVATEDGQAVAKIIDFGVAKALGERLTERTLMTGLGGIVGTLEYMSPEQAEFQACDVDTRADIYSLGVLLYELLTGTTPLTRERLKGAGITEVLRLIREEDPPKPSLRLGEFNDALTPVSAQVERERLTRQLRGDLDWIVMKALEKDRNRRYQTASGLARDIERYLNNEPVEACPPSAVYRFRKFAHRNRRLLSITAAFAVLMLSATTVSTWQAIRATLAEKASEQHRNLAAEEARRAQRHVYDAHMSLAQNAWEDTRLQRLAILLKEHLPQRGDNDLRGFEWFYWRRLADVPLLSLSGHGNAVVWVAYSDDGKLLASASHDRTARIWNATDGELLHTLQGHSRDLISVAFSPDGKLLATGSMDMTAKLWDIASGREQHTLKGHSGWVASVAFSPDGQLLATASHDRTIRVWNVATGSELHVFPAHDDLVMRVEFSRDGKRLASASKDKTVKIWDTATWSNQHALTGHSNEVVGVAFSPDGGRVASASLDHTAKVWNVDTGACEQTLVGHQERVYGISFSPDGRRLASSSFDQTVRIWDAASGRELASLKGHTGWIPSVVFSPDGQRLATASADRTVKVWDAFAGQGETIEMRQRTRVSPARSVAFSPDGSRLASTSDDSTIALWDTRSGLQVGALAGHERGIYAVVFNSDGSRLASTSADHTVKVWDVAAGTAILSLKGSMSKVGAVAFSPDGRWLAAAGDQHTVRVYDAHRGDEKLTLGGHTDLVTSVAFSPDGQRLASASRDMSIRIWDSKTGEHLRSLVGHEKGPMGITCVVFSPGGNRIVSSGADQTVRLWDAATGKALLTLNGHVNWVASVAFDPKGDRLASASADKTIKLWDLVSGQETLTLRAPSEKFVSVAFSNDGRRLAGAEFDGRVWLWDARPWTPQLRLEHVARGVIERFRTAGLMEKDMLPAIERDQALSVEIKQVLADMLGRAHPACQ